MARGDTSVKSCEDLRNLPDLSYYETVPVDPVEAATALARVVSAQGSFSAAREARREAIVAAVRAEVPLREVASAADCSHESVRRIVAADGVVTIELRAKRYPLTRQTIEMLVYKLAGHGAGAFPRDVELLGAGNEWLPAAGKLAFRLRTSMSDEDGVPVRLSSHEAFALHQVLRLTHMTVPSPLYDLFEALGGHERHVAR